MLFDIQLLFQTAIYFVVVFLGFIVAVTTGVTMINLNGGCVLYNSIAWINSTTFTVDEKINTDDQCHFVIYFNVFACIIYGFGMAVYHTIAVCRKDKNIGTQMWVMPFLLLNTLVAVIQLIASCIMSVGFGQWCDNVLQGKKKGVPLNNCRDFQNMKNVPKGTYVGSVYDNTLAAEVASWLVCIFWTLQAVLSIFRYLRNRRISQAGYHQDQDIITESEDPAPATM